MRRGLRWPSSGISITLLLRRSQVPRPNLSSALRIPVVQITAQAPTPLKTVQPTQEKCDPASIDDARRESCKCAGDVRVPGGKVGLEKGRATSKDHIDHRGSNVGAAVNRSPPFAKESHTAKGKGRRADMTAAPRTMGLRQIR